MVKENLHIALIQYDIVWEKPEENCRLIEARLKKLDKATDIVVLPETFSTGFSMNPEEVAEDMNGKTVTWMKRMSSNHSLAICGSLIIQENKQFYNRFLFVMPSGEISTYDKRHLFSMGNETEHFAKGRDRIIIEYLGWKICPLICYDLRFPVWSRNQKDYDVLVYSANWPAPRAEVWKTLLVARAIENQSYVVGVNRIGKDVTGIKYKGDSVVLDSRGKIISKTNHESIYTAKLSHSSLTKFRKNFPVLDDADSFFF